MQIASAKSAPHSHAHAVRAALACKWCLCGGARRSGGGTMGGTSGTGETSGTLSAPVVPMKREARRGRALAPREGDGNAPRRERALPPGGRHSCPQEGDAHPPRVETHIPPGWRRSCPQVVFAHTQRAQELPDVMQYRTCHGLKAQGGGRHGKRTDSNLGRSGSLDLHEHPS